MHPRFVSRQVGTGRGDQVLVETEALALRRSLVPDRLDELAPVHGPDTGGRRVSLWSSARRERRDDRFPGVGWQRPRHRFAVVPPSHRLDPVSETYISAAGAREDVLLQRLVVCCLLLGVLGGLSVHYGATSDAHHPYPTVEALDAEYEEYVGQRALVFGRVVSAHPDDGTVTITQRGTDLLGELTVVGADRELPRGASIQVYGTLEAGHRIDAANVVVINTSSGAELYKYAVSAVGALVVLVAFFSRWRFDRDSLAFEVRDDG